MNDLKNFRKVKIDDSTTDENIATCKSCRGDGYSADGLDYCSDCDGYGYLIKRDKECSHKESYHFHDNAPAYCPECGSYVDGGRIVTIRKKNE